MIFDYSYHKDDAPYIYAAVLEMSLSSAGLDPAVGKQQSDGMIPAAD